MGSGLGCSYFILIGNFMKKLSLKNGLGLQNQRESCIIQ